MKAKAETQNQPIKPERSHIMKKILTGALVIPILVLMTVPSYASDWDKAGKILTAFEGLRIISRGEVDILGNLTGIDKDTEYAHRKHHSRRRRARRHHRRPHKHYAKHHGCYQEIWVPQYEWRRKYIPKHKVHDPELGKIIVEGHYVKYKVESGGYFKTSYVCH
jgi:hypothetical protein